MSEKQFKNEVSDNMTRNLQALIFDNFVNYTTMQSDIVDSEAYIMSKKYSIKFEDAKMAIKMFGSYPKAMEFTQLYFGKLKGDAVNYIGAVESAARNGFGFAEKETSLLEQERMNTEGKFGIDPRRQEIEVMDKNRQTHHRRYSSGTIKINFGRIAYSKDDPRDSSHQSEHEFESDTRDRPIDL